MKRSAPFLALLPLAALLAGCSLAADVTPPPGYSPEPPAAAVSSGPSYPLVVPNAANGAPIYAEKCAPCHGESGLGDGPQSGQLSIPVAAIGSPELARAAAPSRWYQIVTVGNLERFMPGFTASLTDQQRWDVVAYVYSLSAGQDAAQGEAIYQAQCASCHGERGQGDGQQVGSLARPAGDLTDLAEMSAASLQDHFDAVSNGVAPAMPGFAGSLSEAERWSVVSYLRQFSLGPLAANQPLAQAATPEPEASPAAGLTPTAGAPTGARPTGSAGTPSAEGTAPAALTGTIAGKVTNGSGGQVPAGLHATLRVFESMDASTDLTAPVAEDGSYQFEDVELSEGRIFVVTVDVNGTVFNSDIAHPAPGETEINLPVTFYETTTDTAGLAVDRMHVFFDFSEPGLVQVVELFIVSNPGNKMVVAPAAGQPVLTFNLPEGAQDLAFEDSTIGERYVQTERGFGDTAGVLPGAGQHQVLFAYSLPYERKASVTFEPPLPVNAAVIMVPEVGVKATSDQLQDGGARDVQGMNFRVYNASNLPAGQPFAVALSGSPKDASGANPAGDPLSDSDNRLFIGLGVFGAALVGAGVFLYSRRPRPAAAAEDAGEPELAPQPGADQDADTLMEAIIALDDQYKAGQLPEDAYHERRAALKEQLRQVMKGA